VFGHCKNPSVIINNFNIFRPFITPAETDSELVIDADAPLAFSVATQRFKPVSRRCAHVAQAGCQIQLHKFAQRSAFDRRPLPHMLQPKERFCVLRPERLDHAVNNNENRY
jgi:hypothetical protein